MLEHQLGQISAQIRLRPFGYPRGVSECDLVGEQGVVQLLEPTPDGRLRIVAAQVGAGARIDKAQPNILIIFVVEVELI